MKDVDDSVKFLIESLNNKKCFVFCGAGISLNSNIPTVEPLLNQLLCYLNADEEDIKTFLYKTGKFHLPMPFEAIIQSLKDKVKFTNSDLSFIEAFAHIFEGMPNINHYLLANLLKEQKIHCIVTTNFDTCIEQALGWSEGDDRIIIPYKEEPEYLKNVDLRGKIIKLHGCKTVPDLLGTTVSQITKPLFMQKTNLILSKLFFSKAFDTALFLGYSCSDKWDISDFFNNYELRAISAFSIIYWQHTYNNIEKHVDPNVEEMLGNHNTIFMFGDTNELVRTLWENYGYGQFPENTFLNADFCLKEYTPKDTELVLSRFFQDSNRHNIAEKYCLRAVELYYNRLTTNPQEYICQFVEAIITYGNYYISIYDTQKAESLYKIAIQCILDNYGLNKEFLSVILIDLFIKYADALTDNGKPYEAEKNYQHAVNFFLKSKLFIPPLASVYNSIALLYEQIKPGKVYIYFHKALKIYKKYAKEDPLEYAPYEAQTLNNIAMFHWKNNEFTEAIRYMNQSLKIARKLADTNEIYKEDVGLKLNNLGLLFHELGNFEDAEKAYNEAIKIQRELVEDFPQKHLNKLSLSLSNLSNLYIENQLEKAKKVQQEALDIRRKLANHSIPMAQENLIQSLINMGNICYKLNEFEQGLVYLQEALPICRNLVKINEKQYMIDLSNALTLYCNISEKTNHPKQTDKLYQELFEVVDKLIHWNYKAYVEIYANIYFNFANYKYRIKHCKQAMTYYQKALDIYHRLLKSQPTDYYRKFIECCHRLISTINSEELNLFSEKIFSSMCQSLVLFVKKDPDHLPIKYVNDLVTVALNLGINYYEAGDLYKSKRIYLKALKISDLCQLTDCYWHLINPAKIYYELANVLSQELYFKLDNNQRLLARIEKMYLKALYAYSEFSDQLDETEQYNYSILLTRLANFYQERNNIDNAIIYFEKAVMSYETLCKMETKMEYLQRLSNAKYYLYQALINK